MVHYWNVMTASPSSGRRQVMPDAGAGRAGLRRTFSSRFCRLAWVCVDAVGAIARLHAGILPASRRARGAPLIGGGDTCAMLGRFRLQRFHPGPSIRGLKRLTGPTTLARFCWHPRWMSSRRGRRRLTSLVLICCAAILTGPGLLTSTVPSSVHERNIVNSSRARHQWSRLRRRKE